ncbi:aminotransferase in exopolysaccharide biosynthesis [Methylobacter tundripaludum]|uniref:GDP-perosamine synthase n=1 Tax=Methylobacter tundripaludum TaxID=173365 RepID=A0A2S6HI46_9GAMM|nr:LegC family aminotransferase [Methylobacter tundripaludum]PPK77148.1 aminotransferase in exopolysaccharide biosynthesis [Methylobacter tundripaludum]
MHGAIAEDFIRFVREIYQTDELIPLHEPRFQGREKEYLIDAIDSTFVSSVGQYVDRFEADCAKYTGAKYAVATVNGTAALHAALLLVGVKRDEEVITQALTFVATCNAIHYCGAEPVFVDVDRTTLGLSAQALEGYLDEFAEDRNGETWNKQTGKRIAACLPMHTFGHPVDMGRIVEVCGKYHIPVVEDAAEALGSTLNKQHCGTFGRVGVLSFNGNKIMTTGGGGMILTDDETLAKQAKHLTTTAKQPHSWQFMHDQVGFNYRMPNLNAALGVAQLECVPLFVTKKRELAARYIEWSQQNGFQCFIEPEAACSNYWLNAVVLENLSERDAFLKVTNEQGIMTRPIWEPMHRLPMYRHCRKGVLVNTEWAADRIVNIPSSVI